MTKRKSAVRGRQKSTRSVKKASARKTSARRSKGRSTKASVVIDRASGHVYVLTRSGVKSLTRHSARKGSAREIRSNLGLTRERSSSARSLIAKLEKAGVISKS